MAGSGDGTAGGRIQAGHRTAGQADQPLPEHGFRPILHQLPRVGEGQLDVLVAEEHQGRAGRAAGVPQPEFLSRSVLAEPADAHSERRREGRRQRRQRPALQSGLPRCLSRIRPAARAHIRRGQERDDAVADEAGDLRQRLAEARRTDRREPVRHLGSVPRLPQRGRHRLAIRHDAARTGRKADQHLALRHVARLADGACRARPDLFRAARERDRHLPSGEGEQGQDREHVFGLSRHHGPAPARDRQRVQPVLADNGRHHPVHGAGRSGERAGKLRGARARRHLVRLVPSHGARQGRHREVPAPAAEQMHSGAAAGRQSGAERLRGDVHR